MQVVNLERKSGGQLRAESGGQYQRKMQFYLECDLRYDLLVEDLVIVEVKSVDCLLPVHEAQLLTYLKLLGKPKGILLNFNCFNIFKEGQKTMVTELFSKLPKE